jgi:hypothetical protein
MIGILDTREAGAARRFSTDGRLRNDRSCFGMAP